MVDSKKSEMMWTSHRSAVAHIIPWKNVRKSVANIVDATQ